MPLREKDRRNVEYLMRSLAFGETLGEIAKILAVGRGVAKRIVDAMVAGKVLRRFEFEAYPGARKKVKYKANDWVTEEELEEKKEELFMQEEK